VDLPHARPATSVPTLAASPPAPPASEPAPASIASSLAPPADESHRPHGPLPALTLAALGIVFGDIGTSPLYTLNECIQGEHGVGTSAPAVLGVLSLIFWSLTMVVTVKYLAFVMRADNHGEGGILALLALLPGKKSAGELAPPLTILVIIGAALLYGDGVITPAISLLSAVEGLGVATARLTPYVVPLTCAILLGLFSIQRHGTSGIGRLFGPVMLVWFLTIGGLGVWQIARAPHVLAALSPAHALGYLGAHGLRGAAILGAVVLAVTGGEALYADMGHFGAKPIRLSWLMVVFPALVASYFGQGALVLSSSTKIANPFFAQVPQGNATLALVVLSTFATVIASQALISGVYSLTHQAMQLGFFPRVTVRHTSSDAEGQIYLPEVNWVLALGCLVLVVQFGASSKLAAAYGIAVSGTMAITSICYYSVARRTWGWSVGKALPLLVLFLSFDIPFFLANLTKFVDGGYVPVGVAAVISVLMLIWNRGYALLAIRNRELSSSQAEILDDLEHRLVGRLPETTVFLAQPTEEVPRSLHQFAMHLRVLGERVVILTVLNDRVPWVDPARAVSIETLDATNKVYRVKAHIGFMEDPDVPRLLRTAIEHHGLPISLDEVSYVITRQTLLATSAGRMGQLTESIFAFMLRNAKSAADYFQLPPDAVVEIGKQIDL
jgi:KUP system potassium uptake protein